MKTNPDNTPKIHLINFESPLPHSETPDNQGVFRFIDHYGDKMGTKKNILYRGPKLVTSGKKWYVQYSYRDPVTLKWKRFKVYEDINRIRSMEYGRDLLEAVRMGLSEGFSPFDERIARIKKFSDPFTQKEWTINQAFNHFKTKWIDRGNADATTIKYNRAAQNFLNWCNERGIQHDLITSINHRHIESYLTQTKIQRGLTSRGYNNEKGLLGTMFNFFLRDCNAKSNPCHGIRRQKTVAKKHRYYDTKTFLKLKEAMQKDDPYLLFACQVVYYLCLRSEKELSLFRVGAILPDRKQVFIKGEDTKTSSDRFIPLSDEMLKVFEERKILGYPEDHYVFSVPHKNKFVPDGKPGQEPFSRGFFSKRFAKIRKQLGLDSAYTIYSYKHTRAVHLKLDGAQDEEIMHVMGHFDFSTTVKYLRDLGLTVDPESINRKTRKF